MSSRFVDRSEAEMVVEVNSLIEEAKRKLSNSEDQILISIFEDLLQNIKVDETADRFGISRRSVERKRAMIRTVLKDWMFIECERFGQIEERSG